MSFSYYNEEDDFQYAGTSLDGLFARRANILNPAYWAFIAGIIRFSRQTRKRLHANRLQNLTLGDYCHDLGLSTSVVNRYVMPMASAIWSSPFDGIREFPMEAFARFYENHGLLSTENRPTWFTVRGGSHTYVRRFQETFKGTIRLSCPVTSVRRTSTGAVVSAADGSSLEFDRVVMAAHANQSLHVLQDASPEERDLLGAWDYSRNRTILHSDTSFLPSCRRAWASWNYLTGRTDRPDDPACLTYHMNRLQQLRTAAEYCVTLNPRRPVDPALTLGEFAYEHPLYDFRALRSQERLPSLNGQRNTFFCGSYFRNGFHDDAVASAVDVARAFGMEL